MNISKIKEAYKIIKEHKIVDSNVLDFMLTSSVRYAIEETDKKSIEIQKELFKQVPKLITNFHGNIQDEKKKSYVRMLGLFTGLASKELLKSTGLIVDYKINGEDISDLEKLHELSITERIQLAVKEERYLDAANLKKLLDEKNGKSKNERL